MSTKVCNFSAGDWVTTIGDMKRPWFSQVFKASQNFNSSPDLKALKEDGFESTYVHKNKANDTKSKHKKQKKRKHNKHNKQPLQSSLDCIISRNMNCDIERASFRPYTSSYFQYNKLYKGDALPKYLNSTVASEMKRKSKDYWPSRYYVPAPFVASCCTRNTHNLLLLKQETFAKMKAAVLPFRSTELNDQNINNLRSIKRSIEKYWKL